MPKKHRLTRADIKSLPSREKRFSGTFFMLSTRSRSEDGVKCACVVSKKVALRAHDRNLIKRRCRAIIRTIGLSDMSPAVLIFTAKKTANGARYGDLLADIARLLNNASITQ